MFKEILSISGKPGLFKMISQAKNIVIVESLIDGKRQPSFQNEKISLLSEVSMFTTSGEKPLREIFKNAFELEEGKKIEIDVKAAPDDLRQYFAKVLPDFDKEKIYPTDIKKFIIWYNILVEKNITDFDEPQEEDAENVKAEKPKTAEHKLNTASKAIQKSVKANSAGNRQTTRVSNKKGS
jgi:hypothetical protein